MSEHSPHVHQRYSEKGILSSIVEGLTTSADAVIQQRRRKVLCIYTGGTLGMQRIEDGSLAPKTGYLTKLMQDTPDFHKPQMPEFDVIEWDPLIDSSDVDHADWATLARTVEKEYFNYDGFIVFSGTDTMAYTGCALSFMLENLGKPVIITGSCVPACEVYNDAMRNMLVSMLYASAYDIQEVCIFFGERLLRATRACKLYATSLQAFDSPAFPPIGKLRMKLTIREELLRPQAKQRLRVETKMNPNVGVIRLIPGFSDGIVHNMLLPPIEGCVVEVYGTGTSPRRRMGLVDSIREACDRGVVVVVTSQCNESMVDLNLYATGTALRDCGVVSGRDMTTEAAATKLSYLLALGIPSIEVKRLMTYDMRGEITMEH